MKKKYITLISVGDELINEQFALKSVKELKTRDNKRYYDVVLADKTGEINGKVWQDHLSDSVGPEAVSKIVSVSGKVDQYNAKLQLTIQAMKVAKNFELEEFLPVSENNPDNQFKKIKKIIQEIQNPYILQLLNNIFINDTIFQKKFKQAVAAEKAHHAYIGGLMDHILEMMTYAHAAASTYASIDNDLITAGVLLHDIGKIEELAMKSTIVRTSKGALIGHMVLGTIFVHEKIKEISDFPPLLKEKILHLILTHHGKLEYGCPVRPQLLESMVLYYADELSAKIRMTQDLVTQTQEGVDFTEFHRLLETRFFVGNTSSDEPELVEKKEIITQTIDIDDDRNMQIPF